MTTIDLTTARALVERLRDAEAAIRYSRDMIESLIAERDSFETLWRSTMDVLEAERAERDALAKDAAIGRFFVERAEWWRHDIVEDERHASLSIRLPYDVDLSCRLTREDALQAAMKGASDDQG